MSIGITVLKQIAMMFAMMSVGYGFYKKKMIDEHTTLQITNLLMYLCTPMIIVEAFSAPYDATKTKNLLVVFIGGVILLGSYLLISQLIFKKKYLIEQFAMCFANSAFIGIPLVIGLVGQEYVFYLSMYLIVWNLYMWTMGIYLVSGGDKSLISLKKVLLSPAFLGVGAGLLLYLTPLALPDFILKGCSYFASMNTPLAMIVLGAYLARGNLKDIFTEKTAYVVNFYKLVLFPLFTLFVLKFVPNSYYEVKLVLLIVTSAPTALMCAMMAQKFGGDYEYGARIVCLSTILCLITIPILITLTSIIW